MDSTSRAGEITDLVRRGRLIPATDTISLPLPPGGTGADSDSSETVSDLREDRLQSGADLSH